ncbi:MAG: tRNA lysidine(34) synthetase TilS [Bacteroidales bacterium]|nr:tRNA lysidine(34) synthetase TilS [Bacteroidales bacterium]
MSDKKTLLAVSGGIDSMCMAEIFVRRYPCECLAVAHCNFRLRGEESDGDEELVRLWAEEHGVRFHVRTFDTREYAADHGVSIEMAARELRYRWFAELCTSEGYDEVAVAHNANDNAETLMLNLLRGSGIKGLTGMSPVSDIPYSEGASAKLIRPLLDMTRKQIEGFALANRIRYRNDSTNFSSEYKRNMLRNEAFPIFERINPSFIRTINREMGYLSEAEEIVSDYCQKEIAAISADALSRHPEGRSDVRISYDDLLSRKHWRYLLYHILEPYGFNSSTLASMENLLSSDRTISGKRFEADDYVVLTERGGFRIARKIAGPAGNDIMPVRGAGTYHFNGMAFKVEVLDWTADMPLKQPEGTLVLDAERLKFPFVLRGWRDGDWLVPLGMRGKKKVSDLFADLKYDSLMKTSAVMIADVQTEGMAESGHIAGVAGVRIDDRYKVRPSTHSVVRITILR